MLVGKCILSAPSRDKLEALINEYYCSTNYRIDGNLVINSKTGKCLDDMWVCCAKAGRWQMRRRVKEAQDD